MKKFLITILILFFMFALIRITTSIHENMTREQRADLKTIANSVVFGQ